MRALVPFHLAFFFFSSFSSSSTHRLLPPLLALKSSPQTLASELLSLLASPKDAATVPPVNAAQLRSCLRFLVPQRPESVEYRHRFAGSLGIDERGDSDGLIWWPPSPVEELARLAFDSGGDPEVIHRALDPTPLPVPDVEESTENKCQLTRSPYSYRFANEELNSYFAFLFELIVARGPLVGLNVTLSRYDFFHGHLFIANESRRLGILFHAKEYPTYDKELFPYNLGYCQTGSNVIYDDSMNLRNILWLAPLPSNVSKAWEAAGVLVVLDAHPDGIIYKELIPDYVQFARTIYEDDFGDVAVDINYFNLGNVNPSNRIFIS